jgi:hypothetical protein
MSDDKPIPPMVVNVDELEETDRTAEPFGAAYMKLTPSMMPRGGKLGINRMRLRKGHTTCPFHYHLREDEVGGSDPHEVCVYPDTGKVLVRGIKQIGQVATKEYLEGEPRPPRIFELAAKLPPKTGA